MVETVLRNIEQASGVSLELILGRTRHSRVALARLATYRVLWKIGVTSQNIRRITLRKDISTVTKGLRRAASLADVDPEFQTILESIWKLVCPS